VEYSWVLQFVYELGRIPAAYRVSCSLALDDLERSLFDEEGSQAAKVKVNTAKLLIEVSNRRPSRVKIEKMLDEKINKIGQDQLVS